MLSQEIRRAFLRYFKDKGHTIVPSSPVVPHDDPTLLFTNAGMNQFKDVFLGKSERDYTRAATSQKCIRVGGKHNDLENVGHTSRHLTFFEMLGNFSFGDYFKKEAIQFAWEVTTEVFQFSPDKLWISIFQDDDEAFELWRKIVPEQRIVRLGEKDNFWAMGDTGPCGPCSELYFDRGEKYGKAASIKDDTTGERYLEFWNLVFMQFNRSAGGEMKPLPKQSIDTGSGLERVVSLKMGVDSVFGTDILRSLIAQVEEVSGKKYNGDPAFQVIADHIRSLSFAIADGVQPSNVERGYVLRKILRRAVRYSRLLGFDRPFLAEILPRLVDTMGDDYPELRSAQTRIADILTTEEESFFRTLKRGGNILNSIVAEAEKRKDKAISGEDAFKLKDTYGLPLEEILLIANDHGLFVNQNKFEMLEIEAREKSKKAQTTISQEAKETIFKEFASKNPPSEFIGYTQMEGDGKVIGIVKEGAFVNSLKEGEEGQIILSQTPFYAEKGGQVGDTGVLSHKNGSFQVTDCQNPYPGLIVHIGTCLKGGLTLGDTVRACIEASKRRLIQNNHTATHLLHFALNQMLGTHIRQAGSLVDETRLRLDFSHHKALSPQELIQIEDLVNAKVRDNIATKSYEISFDEAQKKPEIKQFFGDKYGAVVRVIDIDFSKELCGGTHTSRTGNIGYFRIVKEGSIAAGVRRIEAVTGFAAEQLVRDTETEAAAKYATLQDENKKLGVELKQLKKSALRELAKELAKKSVSVGDVHFIAAVVATDELASLAEDIASHAPSAVILLAAKHEGRCQLLAKVTPDLVKKNISAVELIKEIAPLVGGSGGGRPESAQAGGKNPDGVENAFAKAKEWSFAKAKG